MGSFGTRSYYLPHSLHTTLHTLTPKAHTHTHSQLEELGSMIAGSLPIHNLGEQELLQCGAVGKHTQIPQLRTETGHSTPLGHPNPIQRLSMCLHHELYHYVAVDEVGTDPGRVEGGSVGVQEHQAHNVITNVTFLVDLQKERNRT